MWKLKDNVDTKELEKFGFKVWEGHYATKRAERYSFDFTKIEIFFADKRVVCTNQDAKIVKKLQKRAHKWLINNIEELEKASLIEKE